MSHIWFNKKSAWPVAEQVVRWASQTGKDRRSNAGVGELPVSQIMSQAHKMGDR